MPIAPGGPTHPTPPLVPQIVPPGQKVTPVEPARQVTPKKGAGETRLRREERRRPDDENAGRDDDRGGLFDVEV